MSRRPPRGPRDDLRASAQLIAGPSAAEQRRARERRRRAARKYQPERIKLLLVAEAPPSALDRYFYFPDVTEQDSLFRYVARGVLKAEPTRANKAELLGRLRDRGIFLIDLIQNPIDASRHADHVCALLRRAEKLEPEKIILIKAPVYDAAFKPLRHADLPVIDERVPFPGRGQQRRFEEAFARALKRKAPRSRRTDTERKLGSGS